MTSAQFYTVVVNGLFAGWALTELSENSGGRRAFFMSLNF
jgi:hypothetical protein